jgi:hypothetical protein
MSCYRRNWYGRNVREFDVIIIIFRDRNESIRERLIDNLFLSSNFNLIFLSKEILAYLKQFRTTVPFGGHALISSLLLFLSRVMHQSIIFRKSSQYKKRDWQTTKDMFALKHLLDVNMLYISCSAPGCESVVIPVNQQKLRVVEPTNLIEFH